MTLHGTNRQAHFRRHCKSSDSTIMKTLRLRQEANFIVLQNNCSSGYEPHWQIIRNNYFPSRLNDLLLYQTGFAECLYLLGASLLRTCRSFLCKEAPLRISRLPFMSPSCCVLRVRHGEASTRSDTRASLIHVHRYSLFHRTFQH
jgi:hypothetical protein